MSIESIASALASEQDWFPQTAWVGARAGFCCEYCGQDMLASVDAYESWQIDHIHPQSHGEGIDDIDGCDNLAVSCKACNFMKRDIVPEGSTRADKIAWAAKQIQAKRLTKLAELIAVRRIAYPE